MAKVYNQKQLNAMKKYELYDIAKEHKLKGRSTMSKAQLIEALSQYFKLEFDKPADAKPDKKVIKAVATKKPEKAKKKKPVANKTKKEQKKLTDTVCEKRGKLVKRLDRSFAKLKDSQKQPDGAKLRKETSKETQEHKKSKDTNQISAQNEKGKLKSELKSSSIRTAMDIPSSIPVGTQDSLKPISEDELSGELPKTYDEVRIVAQALDPYWAHTYWELPEENLKNLERRIGIFEFAHSNYVLKVYNVTEGSCFNIDLPENTRDWYVRLGKARCLYQIELGLQRPTDGYYFIAISNIVQTPADNVSLKWAAHVSPETYTKPTVDKPAIAEIEPKSSTDFKKSSKGHTIQTKPEKLPDVFSSVQSASLRKEPSSHSLVSSLDSASVTGVPSSYDNPSSFVNVPSSQAAVFSGDNYFTSPFSSFSSLDSSAAFVKDERKEMLSARVDAVIYGTVKAGCKLSFAGEDIETRKDGSFSLRVAVPFGHHSIELAVKEPVSGKTSTYKAKLSLEE